MAITLTQLTAFMAVVRRGSVTAAARELVVTQPSVSAAVGALERELGLKLTERAGRTLKPTPAGLAFARYAGDVLALLDQGRRAAREAAEAERRSLRISAVTTAGEHLAPQLIQVFGERNPELALSLDVANRDQVFRNLIDRDADVAITGRIPDDGRFVGHVFAENPIVLVTFTVVIAGLYLHYRRRLQIEPKNRRLVMQLDAAASIRDREELRRTVPVLVLTVLAFFAHQPLHIEPATVALTGAAIGLLVTSVDLDRALSRIEWPTLFFFVALFVMVGALEATGAIGEVADAAKDLTGGDRTAELLGILWIGGIGSAVVDNIPFTTAMIPVVTELQAGADDDAYWWALSLGACFGGNATLIAAAANVAAAGLTERAGRPIGFIEFMRIGIPVTLVSMLLASVYVLLRYVVV